jgi:hypothetical protein
MPDKVQFIIALVIAIVLIFFFGFMINKFGNAISHSSVPAKAVTIGIFSFYGLVDISLLIVIILGLGFMIYKSSKEDAVPAFLFMIAFPTVAEAVSSNIGSFTTSLQIQTLFPIMYSLFTSIYWIALIEIACVLSIGVTRWRSS